MKLRNAMRWVRIRYLICGLAGLGWALSYFVTVDTTLRLGGVDKSGVLRAWSGSGHFVIGRDSSTLFTEDAKYSSMRFFIGEPDSRASIRLGYGNEFWGRYGWYEYITAIYNWERYGFLVISGENPQDTRCWRDAVGAPWWFLFLVLAVLLLRGDLRRMIRSLRNRKRVAAGLCVGCGYDLRATPERCPECGRKVAG